MKTILGRLIIPVAVIISIALSGSPSSYGKNNSKTVEKNYPAPELTITADGQVSCVFENTDIRTVIKYFSDLTGQNFIIDEKVSGSISVIAPTAFPIEDSIKFLESILEMRGYVLIPSGDFIKVMSRKSARGTMPVIQLGGEEEPDAGNEPVTRIIDLKYGNATAISRTLKNQFRCASSIFAYPRTESLIITATDSNIDRLEKLIRALDKPSKFDDGNINITNLISRYSKLTGKNIIMGEIHRRRGQSRIELKVFSPGGLSDEDLLSSMEAIVTTAGFNMEEQGNFIVIEPDLIKMELMNLQEDPPEPGKRKG